MLKDEMFAAIARQRTQLIATLEGLTDEQWESPSLCQGWLVRDVVGHLTSTLEIPVTRFLANVVIARSFNRYADRVAREFGARASATHIAAYRSHVSSRFAPPFIGPIAPLSDVLIHTRDIERPLEIEPTLDPGAVRTVLDYVCGGKARGFVPSSRTAGLRFDATDLGWTSGAGATVVGPGEAIMLAVTGRTVALDDLTGDGVTVLRTRLGT